LTGGSHLWVVGFDDTGQAAQVREVITSLAWEKHQLILVDVAVAVRYLDGCFTLDGEPFLDVTKSPSSPVARFLAGLALGAPPLTGAAVGAVWGGLGAVEDAVGISEEFVRGVEGMIKPGTSALFVLDKAGDMDRILQAIRGLGGTVLKTNVDLERARLIQSTLKDSFDAIQQHEQ
jgi:uncharacterized membrane protein